MTSVLPHRHSARRRAELAARAAVLLAFAVFLVWHRLDAFGNHIYWRWLENSLLYSLSATAITIGTGIPAGYGLAIGSFPGREIGP